MTTRKSRTKSKSITPKLKAPNPHRMAVDAAMPLEVESFGYKSNPSSHYGSSRSTQQFNKQKRDVSRNAFIACFFFGVIAFCLDISSKIMISREAYDFLVYFIGIFTANYMVRRGTDAWSQTKTPYDPSNYAAPAQLGVSQIPTLQVPPQPGAH